MTTTAISLTAVPALSTLIMQLAGNIPISPGHEDAILVFLDRSSRIPQTGFEAGFITSDRRYPLVQMEEVINAVDENLRPGTFEEFVVYFGTVSPESIPEHLIIPGTKVENSYIIWDCMLSAGPESSLRLYDPDKAEEERESDGPNSYIIPELYELFVVKK